MLYSSISVRSPTPKTEPRYPCRAQLACGSFLENALKDYTGTVLYVSHDRYFINQTATRILELTGQTLVNYIGNYDYYLEKKEELTRIYAPAADAAAPECVFLTAEGPALAGPTPALSGCRFAGCRLPVAVPYLSFTFQPSTRSAFDW